ncbi:ribonuclease p subunit p29 [Anaeramoeba ignava]|uniref:Ribonuclease P protein subunit p29 n=1 Tax=Anaeramoeba ignava TaxID=1746090 RepID=A0A9Q0LD35_ANAIG|nr:ribonuclease p subunit p29 [Anaeramoeba ignava]
MKNFQIEDNLNQKEKEKEKEKEKDFVTEYIEEIIRENPNADDIDKILETKVENKQIQLESRGRKEVKKEMENKIKQKMGKKTYNPKTFLSGKILSSKERKKKQIYKIQPENIEYLKYIPLNHLWNQYIDQLFQDINLSDKKISQSILSKIARADFHGCILTVIKSKCPSLIGINGIVLQETKSTFKIITKENKLKSIPKKSCIFGLKIQNQFFTIYGQHIEYRAAERSSRKFKSKTNLNL